MGNTPILQMGMLKHTALDKAGQLQYKIGRRLSFLVLATTLANKNKGYKSAPEMLLTSALQKTKSE